MLIVVECLVYMTRCHPTLAPVTPHASSHHTLRFPPSMHRDSATLRFCEAYANDFPMSDTFKIVHGMVEKALSQVIPLSPASLHLPVKRVICSRLTRQLSHSVVLVV